MRLVLLGPPGAGKGTQANRIAREFGIVHIATGDIFRANVAGETPLGREARTYMDRGELVPDDIVIRMVEDRLDHDDARSGFLLDGFPRTVPQAEALDGYLEEEGRPLDGVLCFDVPEEELLVRLDGRREAEARSDDTQEVIRQRLAEYHAKTSPLEAFYRERGLLHTINAVGPVDDVSERVVALLRRIEGERA